METNYQIQQKGSILLRNIKTYFAISIFQANECIPSRLLNRWGKVLFFATLVDSHPRQGSILPLIISYFPHSRDKNCVLILFAKTNDALDQGGAVRHRVGPKHHEFQLKLSWTWLWIDFSSIYKTNSSCVLI